MPAGGGGEEKWGIPRLPVRGILIVRDGFQLQDNLAPGYCRGTPSGIFSSFGSQPQPVVLRLRLDTGLSVVMGGESGEWPELKCSLYLDQSRRYGAAGKRSLTSPASACR